MGAGMPAKNATRWMAPAAPVFAGTPAPTETLLNQSVTCNSLRRSTAGRLLERVFNRTGN
ncbi:hypothetical protein CMV24_15050 [Pseudomonas plecoglossicida]|uniref:Uncharacterized protein n=1 Tax=Pseudomonas plecoglossicida TaxID=70775 RepID=A0A2A3M4R9_PSEDL|nr:hypothetical protein CMV24_15050 [Pseudomonas plecoglossicida]